MSSTTAPNGVVAFDRSGNALIPMPARVSLPAIVHARFTGSGSFRVSAVSGSATAVTLAAALHSYDGTFPVGFTDLTGAPTTALRIDATGNWHLDIAPATLAPRLQGGVSGFGDAVLAYTGPAARLHVHQTRGARFVVREFGTNGLAQLATARGTYDAVVALHAGPSFIAVTSTAGWSIVVQ